jgi:hypothetical protein
MDTPPPLQEFRFTPVADTSIASAPFGWSGFLAGLFNCYILAKTVWIYQSELRLLITGSVCGSCEMYAYHQVYFAVPFWVGVGCLLWLRVRHVTPRWSTFAALPVRLAFLGWVSVVLSVIGANVVASFSQAIEPK